MYCANCRAEVKPINGYCERCGIQLNARLCPNGHIMDPTWTECQYCPPTARHRNQSPGTSANPPVGPPGAFTKGATILEQPSTGDRGDQARGSSPKPRTVMEGGGGGRSDKGKTVYDPGVQAAPEQPGLPAGRASSSERKLVGWLVTFSQGPTGRDFRLREGRNLIGSERECEICVDWDPTISGRHAVIRFQDGQFYIKDCDSMNGTKVNQQDLFAEGAVLLQNRDSIELGKRSVFTIYMI